MILQETYTLSNGLAIPKIGLGTWIIPDNEVADKGEISQEDVRFPFISQDGPSAAGGHTDAGFVHQFPAPGRRV